MTSRTPLWLQLLSCSSVSSQNEGCSALLLKGSEHRLLLLLQEPPPSSESEKHQKREKMKIQFEKVPKETTLMLGLWWAAELEKFDCKYVFNYAQKC